MTKKRKEYRLPEETIKVIEKTKSEKELATETEALCYIIASYEKQKRQAACGGDKEEIAELVVNRIQERYKNTFDRIRLASTFAERYSYMILDAVNTMLYDSGADFLMRASGQTMHDVLKQSQRNLKEIIEHNKQVKDNKREGK